MALRRPTAKDKIAFFTRRTIGNKGKLMIWRFEGEDLFNIEYTCPNCGKSGEKQLVLERKKMSIKDPITGKRKQKNAYVFACDYCKQDIIVEQWAKAMPGRKKISQ
jgi:predicted RNA-binding Zn-ribbon protein involved in translation (DUF1610 family)